MTWRDYWVGCVLEPHKLHARTREILKISFPIPIIWW